MHLLLFARNQTSYLFDSAAIQKRGIKTSKLPSDMPLNISLSDFAISITELRITPSPSTYILRALSTTSRDQTLEVLRSERTSLQEPYN